MTVRPQAEPGGVARLAYSDVLVFLLVFSFGNYTIVIDRILFVVEKLFCVLRFNRYRTISGILFM